MVDTLRGARPHDAAPRLVMNGIGMPKRPEIGIADFAKAVDMQPEAAIPFEPKLFGTAANNGQMSVEVEAGHKVAGILAALARGVTGKSEIRPASRNILKPFVTRLSRKKAS